MGKGEGRVYPAALPPFRCKVAPSPMKNPLLPLTPSGKFFVRSAAPLVALVFLGSAFSATPPSMPRRISERMWVEGKYEQGGAGAPKLLIVYPEPGTVVSRGQTQTRYAGRVDPPAAAVYLGDERLKVYPGGVFTGLLSAPSDSRTVRFTAKSGGKTTTVSRTVRRERAVPGLRHRPLRFGAVSPSGAQGFWLRAGSSVPVSVEASEGNIMRARIGPEGGWVQLVESRPGLYSGRLMVDEYLSPRVGRPIQFQLRPAGPGGQGEGPVSMTSTIEVRRMEPGQALRGMVREDVATFLKYAEGWERWGNWIDRTPFPVTERHGDRLRVDFGRGVSGYVEADKAAVDASTMWAGLPALGEPQIQFYGKPEIDKVTLEWRIGEPVAHVMTMPGGMGGGEIRFKMIGAASAKPGVYRAPITARGGIRKIEILAGGPNAAPEVRVQFSPGELWGYGFSRPDGATLQLAVRTRPRPLTSVTDVPRVSTARPRTATSGVGEPRGARRSSAAARPEPRQTPGGRGPLRGLTIMVDAGHGGDDVGALGPSGLTEADVNLVLSALLGDRLQAMGAEVVQARVDNSRVELDERISEALRLDPDLFVSVHSNSVDFQTDPMADRGPKVFYHYAHSIPVATRVAARLNAVLEPGKAPVVLENVFRVNRNISPCPSILVEGAFVCNPEDEVRLRDQRTLERMADAIAAGVADVLTAR